MDQPLKGKKVILTGATGILGKRFSKAILESGADIALFDVNLELLRSFKEEVASEYPNSNIHIECCDITNKKIVQESVERSIQELGGLDILHNNAASKSDSLDDFFLPYETYKEETWDQVMNVNVKGMFLLSQAVGSFFVKQKKGNIIQTSSIYGHRAPDQRIYEGSEYNGRPINTPAVYSASKAAVHGLTMYLSTYWGDKGIRVNTLTPGGVSSGQNGIFFENYSQRVPLGRMAESDDLASALIFLASDMSSYITGQNLIVDGGLSVW